MLGRSSDKSGPRKPYFLQIQSALHKAGFAEPTLIIDRQKLNANIDQLISDLPDGMAYRIVAKSLPAIDLLAHVRERSGSDRLMTFNLPMLLELARSMPDASQLLGKPLPAQAVKRFFDELPQECAQAASRIQWLVDTPERLAQYAAIAEAQEVDMAINIELDVGLHRGGMEPGEALDAMMETIRQSNRLHFAGVMGYEPHMLRAPEIFGWRNREKQYAWDTYRTVLNQATQVFGEGVVKSATRNAAGSPTFRLYKDTQLANELSVGSVLVKPTDFDTPLLHPFKPASFIATPALKVFDKTRIPVVGFADRAKRLFDPNLDKTIFTYGGYWKAVPEDPPGLRTNATYGRSSNQEMLNGGPQTEIEPDDFVFLRPTQSEAVFLHFGDIAVYDGGEIVDSWPVFPAIA